MITEYQFTQNIPPMPSVKKPCATGGYKKLDSPCSHPAADPDCKNEQNLNKQLNMKVKAYTLYLGSSSKRKHINDLIKELININSILVASLYTQGTTYYYSPSDQGLLYTHIDLYINNPVDIDFYDMEALVNIIQSSQIPVHTYCIGSIIGNGLLYTHIDLYINNPVDIDFYDMEALVNIIQSSQIPVHTYCIGSIIGNALPIFLAGKRRYCYSTSRFKYDNALYWDEDHYWEFDRDKIEINQVRMNIDGLIAQQAGVKALELLQKNKYALYWDEDHYWEFDRDKIEINQVRMNIDGLIAQQAGVKALELLQKNKYVYSDQAVAYNIVHEIIKNK